VKAEGKQLRANYTDHLTDALASVVTSPLGFGTRRCGIITNNSFFPYMYSKRPRIAKYKTIHTLPPEMDQKKGSEDFAVSIPPLVYTGWNSIEIKLFG